MLRFAANVLGVFVLAITIPASNLSAAGGTRTVAQKGQPTHISSTWPEGVGDLVNDPSRSMGLNSWFSEWPNDVNQYGFEIKTIDDVNRLLEKLAKVKTELKQLRLCNMKEPRGLGWVTSLPAGNNTAVIFSIGDQSVIDQWYKHVRKPFGKMEFLDTPIAVPPTLTIFVQHDAIDLDRLQIPVGMTVEAGCTPGVFHRSNTKLEKEQESAKSKPAPVNPNKVEPDAGTKAAAVEIEAFLKKRNNPK